MEFNTKLENFYTKQSPIYKKALKKIINVMLKKCEYINGESLERHNWGSKSKKLENIPKNINLENYESELLNALEKNGTIDNSTIELLWGDIQLGKRIHACIIMWFSVHILRRPVLYIFRNLEIDQKQLQEDIMGTEESSFNIQFIKKIFDEFNEEIQKILSESETDCYKDFVLPELKDINTNDVINKLGNKEAIKPKDIFCCLMNYKQLEKINNKFNEYICNNEELVDMTILIDESDLMAPTSSNNKLNKNDEKDTTECEKLLAKIYKKVKYVLHITGTAHSLLYNITTKLFDDNESEKNYVQLKISKVHKMKRDENYYGLFNDKINFNTSLINTWWDCVDEITNKQKKYTIEEDYNINIKKIIDIIIKRESEYNSLLISEEKIRINQFNLIEKIMNDYSKIFIIIFHGKCLRLYFNKKYLKELKKWTKWDKKKSLTQRLNQKGGIYEEPIEIEKGKLLPNNYCYYEFDTKKVNIKMIYKLLRIFFEKSDKDIKYKTVVTITGKYGERGYSFTSDDFNKYTFHITDQYFLSHSTFNCTDISQRLRIQGKYNDEKLKNGEMKLTLWTTKELEDVIKNFYIKFIKEIEKKIMECENWEEIKELIENIIDNGELKLGKYMKYIDVAKKRKSIEIVRKLDKKNNGFKLIKIDDMTEEDITKWCELYKLPKYICVNEFSEPFEITKYNSKLCQKKIILESFENINEMNLFCVQNKISNPTNEWFIERKKYNNQCVMRSIWKYYNLNDFKNNITEGLQEKNHRFNIYYDEIDTEYKNPKYLLRYYSNEYEIKKCKKVNNDPYEEETYILSNNKIVKSIIKNDYVKNKPENYYWKTFDKWLYLNKNTNKEIVSLKIVDMKNELETDHNILDENVNKFINDCCKKTEQKNIRYGIKDIYLVYSNWCKNNEIKNILLLNSFKEEFEKNGYKYHESKGIDKNKKNGKRGYNILLEYKEKKIFRSIKSNINIEYKEV